MALAAGPLTKPTARPGPCFDGMVQEIKDADRGQVRAGRERRLRLAPPPPGRRHLVPLPCTRPLELTSLPHLASTHTQRRATESSSTATPSLRRCAARTSAAAAPAPTRAARRAAAAPRCVGRPCCAQPAPFQQERERACVPAHPHCAPLSRRQRLTVAAPSLPSAGAGQVVWRLPPGRDGHEHGRVGAPAVPPAQRGGAQGQEGACERVRERRGHKQACRRMHARANVAALRRPPTRPPVARPCPPARSPPLQPKLSVVLIGTNDLTNSGWSITDLKKKEAAVDKQLPGIVGR